MLNHKNQDFCCHDLEADNIQNDNTSILPLPSDPEVILRESVKHSLNVGGKYIILPFYPYIEAQALGAKIETSVSGIPIVSNPQLSLNDIKVPTNILQLEPIATLIKAIELANDKVIIEVQAPYSVLAALIEPMRICRESVYHREEIKEILDKIVTMLYRYIKEAIKAGVAIVSIADPTASLEVLGGARLQEFSLVYLLKLFKKLEPFLNQTAIHLCPRSSYQLEKLGLIKSNTIRAESGKYIENLLTIEKGKGFYGHHCMHDTNATKIHIFHLNDYINSNDKMGGECG